MCGVNPIIENLHDLHKLYLYDPIDENRCRGLGTMDRLEYLWSYPWMAQKDIGGRSKPCKKWCSRVTYSIRHSGHTILQNLQ